MDSTGSIAWHLLKLIHGVAGIPEDWLQQLELRDVIERLARDLWSHFGPEERPPCDDESQARAGGDRTQVSGAGWARVPPSAVCVRLLTSRGETLESLGLRRVLRETHSGVLRDVLFADARDCLRR